MHECTVIVPTLGQSPHLAACLEALRQVGAAEVVVVVPHSLDPRCLGLGDPWQAADRWIRTYRPGFSAANNEALSGLDPSSGAPPFVATVNDDAVVEADWLSRLLDRLRQSPEAAAAQGLNLQWDGRAVDGCGIGWNRWWQAVQIGHGLPAEGFDPPGEIFGVSATAAVYRLEALQQVTLERGPFDETLFAYYEDVDLAARLRAAGWGAFCVPEARARHAGSVSGRRLPFGGRQLIHANRHLILARMLGRSWWRHWPRIATRDLLDLVGRLASGDLRGAGGIAAAAGRAVRRLPAFAHRGPATLELDPWTSTDGIGSGGIQG